MISLVYLTTSSPSKIGDDLTLAGYCVFEAVALSEVLYLQEHDTIDAVIIGADVEQAEEKERQLRGIVMRLKPDATAAYVQWELSLMFPETPQPVGLSSA